MYEPLKNSNEYSERLPEDALTKDDIVAYSMRPALASVRFLNYIIDIVFCFVVVVGSFGFLGILSAFVPINTEDMIGYATPAFYLFYFSYWIVFEYFTGRTVGKFITKTKVICPDGSRPGFWRIVGRTFARLIPFEAFSFLANRPIGIHDSVSNTIVVNDIDLYDFGERRTYYVGGAVEEGY